ncbi:MAG: DUF4143 domain-containing protein [Deltaproteobacteria bacterium]|nr:DUF4143 domain-containing protein [Deltaproteobacteria bacterium]
MLLYLCYPTSEVKPPINLNLPKSPRLQFLDTGLLNCVAGLQSYYFDQKDLNEIYQGKIAEHIVGQELVGIDSYTNRNPNF